MHNKGKVVASYTYNAWGVCKIVSDSTGIIARINPFRNRSYYYYQEIGLYYLQSRYYDAGVSRFINADDPVLVYDSYTLLSYNTFAYCENIPVNGRDSNGQKLKNLFKSVVNAIIPVTRTVVRAVIANPIAVNVSQKGKFQSLFNLADFYCERSSCVPGAYIYHTYVNCWQKYFGYNDLYDLAFYLGTDMKPHKMDFSYGGKEWILWAWKGDYLNLGAGAELGIYNRLRINGNKTPHWLAATSHAMKMELKLTYKGITIIDYKPQEKQWWITGFMPAYQNVKSNQLKATFKVKFNNSKMFDSFRLDAIKSKHKGITYNTKSSTATIQF